MQGSTAQTADGKVKVGALVFCLEISFIDANLGAQIFW